MTIREYSARLISRYGYKTVQEKLRLLITGIATKKTLRLTSISATKNLFARFRSLVDGSLKHTLTVSALNEELLFHGVETFGAKKRILALHDGSDIRKPHSKELEYIDKVRSLGNKRTISGYLTFNSVAVEPNGKSLRLLQSTPYSTNAPDYVGADEAIIHRKDPTWNKIVYEQLQTISVALKAKNPNIEVVHVLDRGHDDKKLMLFIDKELRDKFVIRVGVKRVCGLTTTDENGKECAVHIEDMPYDGKYEVRKDKILIKKKAHQNVAIRFEWGKLKIDEEEYSLVKVQVFDRDGVPLYDEPMFLLTNYVVDSAEWAIFIEKMYRMRAKIEGIFHFLKGNLGWEEAQVRDYESIKTLLALCFFVGGYFYEIEDALIQNPEVADICRLGGGKGKVTRHFFLKGLATLAAHQQFLDFLRKEEIPPDIKEQMLAFVR